MNVLPIKAAPLVLHAGGARSHPDLPFFDDGDLQSWANWLRSHRLEVMRVWMEDDVRARDNYVRYLSGDYAGALAAWHPVSPNDDLNWFILAVFYSRNGPCTYFARGIP